MKNTQDTIKTSRLIFLLGLIPAVLILLYYGTSSLQVPSTQQYPTPANTSGALFATMYLMLSLRMSYKCWNKWSKKE